MSDWLSRADGDWSGQLIDDRYRVGKKLGSGGMAFVYQAVDERLEREVAIKILRTDREAGTGYARRLFREAKAGARVTHPNTISIYDVGQIGEIVYVVMELLVGSTLEELVRAERRLPPLLVMDMGRQAAEALGAIHAAGIVHRDIKPENLFVISSSAGATVKLLDFSIAKLSQELESSQLTMEGAVLGSAYYMSPEQVRATPVSERSDLYALGCVMYECLTGRPPFDADTLVDLWDKHLSARIPRPSKGAKGVPSELDDLIIAMMAKDPNNRPSSATSVAQRLAEINAVALRKAAGNAPQRKRSLVKTEAYKTARHAQPTPNLSPSEQATRVSGKRGRDK